MHVYHNKNIGEKGRTETRLTALPVNHSFLWGEQEMLIPAVYTGKAGTALDICAKIPIEDMAAFLKKWNYERQMSLKTPEEFEQIDADNPGSREFSVKICLDDTPLLCRMSSGLMWYPKSIIQMKNADWASEDKFKNHKSAEDWMNAYNCDRECCWYFERLSYHWEGEPILSPQKISLAFQANSISITAGHFTTGTSCDGKTIKTIHPVTGQEYTVTLHGCEQIRHNFAEIGAKGVIYPEYCQILSYRITPEIDPSIFSIRDCAEGDHPRMDDTQGQTGRSDGSIAVFMAGKNTVSEKQAASSLYFSPVSEVQWRMVFQVKPRNDVEISFPIKA